MRSRGEVVSGPMKVGEWVGRGVGEARDDGGWRFAGRCTARLDLGGRLSATFSIGCRTVAVFLDSDPASNSTSEKPQGKIERK